MDSEKRANANDISLSRAIVIGGMPRSGTNLARRIVGSHSLVAVPPAELGFYQKIASGWTIEKILTEPKFLERYKPDVKDLAHLELDAVYRHLLARYAASKDKPIPGEKTPLNEFYYRDIQRCFAGSDLHFIHMVRNPFDVVASYKNAPFRGANPDNEIATIATVAADWVRSASLATARTLMLPNTYRMVRFEDLTNDTESVAANLCAFLGLEFERERMLNLSDYQGQRDNTSFTQPHASGAGDEEPKVKQLESRKSHLSEEEIAAIGSVCGEMAQAIGYDDPDFDRAPIHITTNATAESSLQWLSKKLGLRPGRRSHAEGASRS